MQNIIYAAKERMDLAYAALPKDYFFEKGPSNYRFNNITRFFERSPNSDKTIEDEIAAEVKSKQVSLYFGVPWCEKICSFCNFAYSTNSSEDTHRSYLRYLKSEFDIFKNIADSQLNVGSIYFGGGTPTYLSPKSLSDYLSSFINDVSRCGASPASITCEFSTSTIDGEKLEILRKSGVTRISTGVQSLDDKIRQQANLVGTGREAIQSLMLAKEFYDNFNVDLIYGHPYQTHQDWLSTVSEIADIGFPSITLYRLEVKERTSFLKKFKKDELVFVDEINARTQYFIAREVLEQKGYVESPLGWWVKKETLVNTPSWTVHLSKWKQSSPYFGFGQGAFSLGTTLYYENASTLSQWERAIESGRLPGSKVINIENHVQEVNQLMRLIRTAKEFDLAQICQGSCLEKYYPYLNRFFLEQCNFGLAKYFGDKFQLTEGGESLIHWIFDDLIFGLMNISSIENERNLIAVSS